MLEPPLQGCSKEYLQSMFGIKNKKNRYIPIDHSIAMEKWVLSGYTLHIHVFLMHAHLHAIIKYVS